MRNPYPAPGHNCNGFPILAALGQNGKNVAAECSQGTSLKNRFHCNRSRPGTGSFFRQEMGCREISQIVKISIGTENRACPASSGCERLRLHSWPCEIYHDHWHRPERMRSLSCLGNICRSLRVFVGRSLIFRIRNYLPKQKPCGNFCRYLESIFGKILPIKQLVL